MEDAVSIEYITRYIAQLKQVCYDEFSFNLQGQKSIFLDILIQRRMSMTHAELVSLYMSSCFDCSAYFVGNKSELVESILYVCKI